MVRLKKPRRPAVRGGAGYAQEGGWPPGAGGAGLLESRWEWAPKGVSDGESVAWSTDIFCRLVESIG